MKIIFLVLLLLLGSSLPLARLGAAPAAANLSPQRDPGSGPVVPWPLDFPRDAMTDAILLGAWSTPNNDGTTWTLKVCRWTDQTYHWQLSSTAKDSPIFTGTGQLIDSIFVGYWYPTTASAGASNPDRMMTEYGSLTLYLLEDQLHLKMGFTSDKVTELTLRKVEPNRAYAGTRE